MTVPIPAAVLASVLSSTDRHPLPVPRPGGDPMFIVPAPRTPVGETTDADRIRACERLSTVLGREIRGGWSADQLAAEYALCYAAGFEAARRAGATT